jgi:soluble lytic murein transglycosylase-like protein
MSKQLKSGASVPMANRPNILVALNGVADAHRVDPAAIAGMIHLESVWDTKNVTGQYRTDAGRT